jgi:hypothetical protein
MSRHGAVAASSSRPTRIVHTRTSSVSLIAQK